MKAFKKILATCVCGALMTTPLISACGGGGGSGEIMFWYKAGSSDSKIIKDMVEIYNNGQGKEDGVTVTAKSRQKIDKSTLTFDAPNVVLVEDENFKSWAVEGLYHNLTDYYKSSPGNYKEEDIPEAVVNQLRLDREVKNGKRMAGKGADLQGLPFGSTPMVYYYSVDALKNQHVNVISVEEEKLDGTGVYAKIKPHGYAEYKENPLPNLNPALEKSVNLAGEEVYKVFNNRVPMNWEEYRYVSKMFTKSYNSSSPTTYGITQHWWFSYGWSVGGDCVGYNGEKYEFTVADKSSNWLVTAENGVEINGKHYAAGEIIGYGDKIKTADIAKTEGLYKLPSQYDALVEFCRTTTPTDRTVDNGINGYGISTANEDNSAKTLIDGTAAMIASDLSTVTSLSVTYSDKYDIAPALQWKKYDDDNGVYYKGSETFENEYLKVIGETYDGVEFTGEVMKVGNTPVQGLQTNCSKTKALVIPENSDASNYEAAWKFIRWAASSAGQEIYLKTGYVPNQTSLAMSEKYTQSVANKNYWAFANGVRNGSIGDWAYFENGQWITDWESDFNGQLRGGFQTISAFLTKNASAANNAIGKVNIIFNGRK